MSRFALGYRDPQQPDETFGEYQERQQEAYEAMVAALDDNERNDDDNSNS